MELEKQRRGCSGGDWARGGVCELREVEAELIVGSAWAEEGCRGWSIVSFELVGAQAVGGGVPEVLGRERARQGGESDAGLLQVLGRARVGVLGLCAALATAAARWRLRSSAGAAWRGEGAPARGEVGPEAAEVPREAAVKQEVACGLPRRWAVALSAGGAEAERERWVMKGGPFYNFRKFQGPYCKTTITFKLGLK